MPILAFIALVVLVGLFILIERLLKAIGVIKPRPIVPSGIAVGEKAIRTLERDSAYAERHMDALDKMVTLTDYDNGEVWRVLDCKPAIDNTYKFTLQRVG
jgi:hypothetical protein